MTVKITEHTKTRVALMDMAHEMMRIAMEMESAIAAADYAKALGWSDVLSRERITFHIKLAEHERATREKSA